MMHPLIVRAKDEINAWSSDQPRELALAVAALCRDILDHGGLPSDSAAWIGIRRAFDVTPGQSIADSIAGWDDWCRYADVDVNDRDAFVKLGIITWTVKMLLLKFGMLVGTEPISDFDAWKQLLCQHLDKHILIDRN
jgi:hypothetical protein